jgi:hypothetical protein
VSGLLEFLMISFRPILVFAALAVTLGACQPNKPDPAMLTDPVSKLQDNARTFCVRTQANLQNVSAQAVAQKCSCYARRTVRALDKTEMLAYRETGLFNASARKKALTSIDACGLKRPI